MEKNKDIVYTMKLTEFYMLMAIEGIDRIYGFSADMTGLSSQDKLNIINSLVQKGIINVKDDQFVCESPYEKIVRVIKYTPEVVASVPEDGRLSGCICYISDEILVTSMSKAGGNHINIQWMNMQEFAEYIKESSLNPSGIIKLKKINIPSFEEEIYEFDVTGAGNYFDFIEGVL